MSHEVCPGRLHCRSLGPQEPAHAEGPPVAQSVSAEDSRTDRPPSHFPDEIASALTKAERQKLIPTGNARKLIQDVLSTPPTLFAADPLLYRAVDISSQTRTAYYDCLYVALAEREGIELITADDKLVNSVQKQFPFVRHLSTMP